MKYHATIRNITDTELLPAPDSVNNWTLHSFECTDDRLIVMWQFDDVLAEQQKNRKKLLLDGFVELEAGMRQIERDLVELVRCGDRIADVPKALDGIVVELHRVLQNAGQGFG